VPDPPGAADLSGDPPALYTWKEGEPFVRVFDLGYSGTSFNPGSRAQPPTGIAPLGRFHFFPDSRGNRVPILYAAEGRDAAVSETVFHDAPVGRGKPVVPESRLKNKGLVQVMPQRDLVLVELFGHGLRRLGLRPESLTSTDAAQYARTVLWAEALHSALADVDGFVWMSRQFNAEKAIVLFGDRVAETDLHSDGTPVPLEVGEGRRVVESAANRAGIILG
jgi:hypothetical protein